MSEQSMPGSPITAEEFVAHVNAQQFIYAEVVNTRGFEGAPPAVNLWLRGFQSPDVTLAWPKPGHPETSIVWGHHWEHSHQPNVSPEGLLGAVEESYGKGYE